MVKLDSIRLKFNNECIEYLNYSYFKDIIEKDNDCVIKNVTKLKRTDLYLGLKNIEIDNIGGTTTLEMSAKILQENYFDSININNLQELQQKLGNSNIIKVSKNGFYSSGVLRADVTDNLKMEKPPRDYIRCLSILESEKYKSKVYPKNTTIEFRKNVVSEKERIIFYDKNREIIKDEKMMELYQSGKLPLIKNNLRVESGLTTFAKILNEFGLSKEDRTLEKVLNSSQNVNSNIFEKIIEKSKILNNNQFELLFNEINDFDTWNKFKNYVGLKNIIKDCNSDLKLVMELVKRKVKGNVTRYKNEIQSIIVSMKMVTEKQISFISFIEEIRTKLKGR